VALDVNDEGVEAVLGRHDFIIQWHSCENIVVVGAVRMDWTIRYIYTCSMFAMFVKVSFVLILVERDLDRCAIWL